MANIGLAQSKDAQAIAPVYVETWRNTYAGLLPDRKLVRMSFKRQCASWSRTLASRNQVVVLENDGDVVGFGSCDYNKLRRLDYSGEIYTLYLLPDFHGCGFGRQLLFDVLIGRNYDSVLLWILVENPTRFLRSDGRTLHCRAERENLGASIARNCPWLEILWATFVTKTIDQYCSRAEECI